MSSPYGSGAYANPKHKQRVSVSFPIHRRPQSSTLPTDLILSLLLAKSLVALASGITRYWLMPQGYTPWAINTSASAFTAVGMLLWERPWERRRTLASAAGRGRQEASVGVYGFALCLEGLFYLLALSRLSLLRVTALTAFGPLWARGLPEVGLLRGTTGTSKKHVGKVNALFIMGAMVGAAAACDALLGTAPVSVVGYAYVLVHLLAAGQRAEATTHLDPESRGKQHAYASGVAAVLSFGIGVVHWLFAASAVPYSSHPTHSSSLPAPAPALLLGAAAFYALSSHLIDPLLGNALGNHFPVTTIVQTGWPVAIFSTVFVSYVGFGKGITLSDFLALGAAWTSISHLVTSDPRSSIVSSFSTSAAGVEITTKTARSTPFLARVSTFYRHLRATIKTILATQESRQIYFFLCLNLAFMFIQMLYGIWTNSLGLISDSIHMFFDCLALAMGLFASVMATWSRNGKYTYGYSRVETLSGFANGLFLCLISIFIVFEAIQRLLDPPEMNTSQLLVISSIGLAVNLVGMFATGHHHHGHSHGGHDHGHGHSHGPPKPVKHSHDHGGGKDACSHDHDHDHGHAHTHDDHDEDEHDHSGHAHAAHGHSHNMKGVFLHVLADTLGSVGVIISTLLINRFGWTGFDPLASIFIAVLIFASVVPLVADSGRLLVLDVGEEREAEVRNALTKLARVEGVSSYTSPRFWSKDPATMVGSVSIQLAPSPSSHDPSRPQSTRNNDHFVNIDKVVARVQRVLRAEIGGLAELCVQVEPTRGFA